jgi:hypothetical protein
MDGVQAVVDAESQHDGEHREANQVERTAHERPEPYSPDRSQQNWHESQKTRLEPASKRDQDHAQHECNRETEQAPQVAPNHALQFAPDPWHRGDKRLGFHLTQRSQETFRGAVWPIVFRRSHGHCHPH